MEVSDIASNQFQDYLRQCDVYVLPNGSLNFTKLGHETRPDSWARTIDFITAYYITNCSTSVLESLSSSSQLVRSGQSKWSNEFTNPFYSSTDGGQVFIASLYSTSGACTSAWMLLLLLYLSPSHRKKPLLVQMTTILYCITFTVLLYRLTKVSQDEYFAGGLDVVLLTNKMYRTDSTKSLFFVSHLFTDISWLEIVLTISTSKLRILSGIFGAILIIANLTLNAIMKWTYYYTYDNEVLSQPSGYRNVKIAYISLQLAIDVWLLASLLYYTTITKNAKKTSFSRRLLPLAIFNLVLVAAHIVIFLLYVTYLRDNWGTMKWIEVIRGLVELLLCTTVWEWIYDVHFLEKRSEMIGVLGRKVNIDDLLTTQFEKGFDPPPGSSGRTMWLKNIWGFLMGTSKKRIHSHEIMDDIHSQEETTVSSQDKTNEEVVNSFNNISSNTLQRSSESRSQYLSTSRVPYDSNALPPGNYDVQSNNSIGVLHRNTLQDCGDSEGGNADIVYLEEYNFDDGSFGDSLNVGPTLIDNYHEERDRQLQRPIRQLDTRFSDHCNEDLPSFTPLPGFSSDDYWHDEK